VWVYLEVKKKEKENQICWDWNKNQFGD